MNEEATFTPLKDGRFRFGCHKGVACFTACCADLKLVLTPYDILRMKNRLHLVSGDFLAQYTDTDVDPSMGFPRVLLKMKDDERRSCPFVTPQGCSIYPDRPGACRIYPLGRAAMNAGASRPAREKFFLVQEKHCLGFQEDRIWSVEEWMESEGLEAYQAMNDLWLEIVSPFRKVASGGDVQRKIQMFFMASYNLDRFREFLFKSPFMERFQVDPSTKAALERNDEDLLLFGFKWLKFSLFGENTLQVRG